MGIAPGWPEVLQKGKFRAPRRFQRDSTAVRAVGIAVRKLRSPRARRATPWSIVSSGASTRAATSSYDRSTNEGREREGPVEMNWIRELRWLSKGIACIASFVDAGGRFAIIGPTVGSDYAGTVDSFFAPMAERSVGRSSILPGSLPCRHG
jgi:hypothetical protein